ncbi:beta-glucosidase BglX [Enterococcus sp. BWM-S5]|uniref:beta-glucosidase n=1 Tax=Enterococcus larvae TaxID=2794352 RepID=A0ABS4CPU5_9ENTE|nr:beta-glucosidase BglX [Enterococcus larvae]MBP1048470.1 beta-glucosidase BglX [Enterococcus larvae]
MKEEKLLKLLESLSWTEKVGQLVQLSGEFFNTSALTVGPQQKLGISDNMLKHVGSVLNVAGAANTKEIQQQYLEKSSHKIPLLFMADIIYGYRTVFPIPLGLGATWNPDLVKEAYTVIGKEAQSGGAHVTFAPMVDLVRDARWGRCLESTGEDSFLNSAFASAMVSGLQQDLDKQEGIASCVKHFAAYGAAEGGREYNTVDMSERKLRQDYLPSYKAAVDAGCKLVMTSFNTYDGVPVTGNQFILKDILRDEWGFDGVIISDYAAVRELIDHGIAEDNKEAAYLAINATNDIDMKSPCYANELEPLLNEGRIDGKLIDQAVLRVLKLKNDLGLFEDPFRRATEEKEKETLLKEEHRALAKKVTAESIVLLKNEHGLLPLDPQTDKKILLVGPYGDNQELIGLWAVHGKTTDTISIKTGIESYLKPENFHVEKGCDMLESYEFLGEFGATKDMIDSLSMSDEEKAMHLDHALREARSADIIIFAMGEHTMQSGEAGSRTDICLPQIQRAFMKQLIELGKKTILISISGRPLVLTEEAETIDAIMQVWFPGTEGGHAIADVLFGKTNPSGRLSMSFPYSVGQLPLYYSEFKTGRPLTSSTHSGRFVSKYLDSPNAPLFPFGYGLNYSSVQYSDLTLSDTTMSDELLINVTIKNSSSIDCLETVQLYIQDVVGSVVRPVKELKQFKKLSIAGNTTATVQFILTRDELKYYTHSMDYDVETGSFIVFVGPNSEETLEASFQLV